MKAAKTAAKAVVLFLTGGAAYYLVEILWRGHSHISMFILGGICFVLVGCINEFLPWSMGIVQQSLIGATIITVCEFITGLIVNVWLGMGVWDYSNLPFNIMGQICLPFFLAWIPLSCVAIVVDDYIRYWIFDEEKPHYTIF